MRAPVHQVAHPVVQGRLDRAGKRPGEVLRAEQLRNGHKMISQALGLAYQVYRSLQRAGFTAAAIVNDEYDPSAVALQARGLVGAHLVVPASIRKIHVGESELLSHERGEEVLLHGLLVAADRGRVKKMALVFCGCRYDLSIGD